MDSGESSAGDSFHGFSQAYVTTFSLCYIASALMGLSLETLGPYLSLFLLLGTGIGTLVAAYSKNIYLLGFFAGGEAVACVANFLGKVPWVPEFTHIANIVMSVLDLIQSVCLFRLLMPCAREVFKKLRYQIEAQEELLIPVENA